MKASYIGFAAAVLTTIVANGATITQFNFNSTTPDANVGTGTTTPNVGSGTVALVGGTSSTFATGSPGDSAGGTDNSALNVTTFPSATTASGTAGASFATSTSGFNNVAVSFDLRSSATVSRFFQLQYTTNGSSYSSVSGAGTASGPTTITSPTVSATFDNTGLITVNPGSGSQQFNYPYTFTFTSGSAVEDNANFGFRLVSVFDPSNNTNYISAGAGTQAAYSTSGTFRIDDVTVTGTATPEPASLALLGLGAIATLRRRRAK